MLQKHSSFAVSSPCQIPETLALSGAPGPDLPVIGRMGIGASRIQCGDTAVEGGVALVSGAIVPGKRQGRANPRISVACLLNCYITCL